MNRNQKGERERERYRKVENKETEREEERRREGEIRQKAAFEKCISEAIGNIVAAVHVLMKLTFVNVSR